MYTTYRFRLKDGTKRDTLKQLAGNVNFVWNYTNEVARERWKRSREYTTRADINPLLAGASKLLSINSQTVQAAAHELVLRIKATKGPVRFRSGRKNLGWVPFNGQTVKFHGGYLDYNGERFRLWQHRSLPDDAVIKTGCFCEDARGRWYVNLTCETADMVEAPAPKGTFVAVDPGIKAVMTTSDGEIFERASFTEREAERLAKAQRHRKKRQARKINAKIRNRRTDWNHKATLVLAMTYATIFFGAVKPSQLKRTRMAKGVSDAAWHQIKTFLAYKTMRRQGRMLEINEQNTTVTCSVCLKKTGPGGLSGLGTREWTCSHCTTQHQRDVNAARNILRLGHETLRSSSG